MWIVVKLTWTYDHKSLANTVLLIVMELPLATRIDRVEFAVSFPISAVDAVHSQSELVLLCVAVYQLISSLLNAAVYL
jgi:hypothetical protein